MAAFFVRMAGYCAAALCRHFFARATHSGNIRATRSFVSTPLQDGQTNMSCSRRTPSFEIVRKCFMVSPQERHTMVGVLLGTGGERSMAGVEGV
jgi:hypothetical protein